jgi:hypothetical protein
MRVENLTKTQAWEDSRLCPETSTTNAVQEFRLWTDGAYKEFPAKFFCFVNSRHENITWPLFVSGDLGVERDRRQHLRTGHLSLAQRNRNIHHDDIFLYSRICTLNWNFRQSMWARNRVGIRFSYRPARLHRLAELILWNRFLGSINV